MSEIRSQSPTIDKDAFLGPGSADEDLPLVFTVAETAKALKLGRTATYNAIKEGRIPHIAVGRRILVPKAALMRFLEGRS